MPLHLPSRVERCIRVVRAAWRAVLDPNCLLVDRNGVPTAAEVTAAKVHDSRMLNVLLDAVAPVRTGRHGQPRRCPAKLHGGNGHDYHRCRDACVRRGIKHHIARKGGELGERLGRYRWTVERTLAWLAKYRRLAVHYERLTGMHEAVLHLASALICWNYVRRL